MENQILYIVSTVSPDPECDNYTPIFISISENDAYRFLIEEIVDEQKMVALEKVKSERRIDPTDTSATVYSWERGEDLRKLLHRANEFHMISASNIIQGRLIEIALIEARQRSEKMSSLEMKMGQVERELSNLQSLL